MSANRNGYAGQLRGDRLAAHLTQEELAEKTGLSVRAISDLERGRTSRPRRSTMRRIADVLGPSAETPEAPQAAPGAALRPPAQLPAAIRDFTGRRAQVELLAGLLSADRRAVGAGAGGGESPGRALGAVAISVVVGAGGAGKSALAMHVAHQLAPHFPDGQLFLNLRGSSSQPVTPSVALVRILGDLGLDPAAAPPGECERAARFRSLVAGRRLLIVLDDARDAAQVRPLLPGTTGCAVLVTSRISLPDLESARLLDLGSLDEAEALELFAGIIGPARAAAEPGAVRDVLRACGGLPLAIRIAAARLAARPQWSVAALSARLGDARRRLDELQVGGLAVRASFAVSYEQARTLASRTAISPDHAFRTLGLAAGPDIGLPAAAALLGVPRDQAEQALELLVDAHLLQSVRSGRYRFHDLLAVYAAERAEAELGPDQRAAAVRRMLSWYLRTADAAARQIDPNRTHVGLDLAAAGPDPLAFGSHDQALSWLDAEHANLVAAVHQAARQGEHAIAWMLPVTLWDLFSLRGHTRPCGG